VANFFFSVVSSIALAVVAALVTTRIVEPRLGTFDTSRWTGEGGEGAATDGGTATDEPDAKANESRGLRFAGLAGLATLVIVLILTLPDGAPLRDPVTGDIIGATPFMDSLIFVITLAFLICGIAYGYGARTFSGSADVITAVTKTFASLSGLIFMLLMISQFIAFFNFSNIPNVVAVVLADGLEQAGIGALPLLVAMILIITLLDFIMPGLVPKWAIFAPIFVPLFIQLGVGPQTVLAAYRVGDSPVNVITPLMVYLPFIVTVAQRYQKDAGIGTIIALLIPYTVILLGVWIVLYIAWFLLGIPLGPGYPVGG
jgi:aminobenzoyl-glutamate transport protein